MLDDKEYKSILMEGYEERTAKMKGDLEKKLKNELSWFSKNCTATSDSKYDPLRDTRCKESKARIKDHLYMMRMHKIAFAATDVVNKVLQKFKPSKKKG